jgi:SAM-dependent methyltransferase
MKNQDKWQPSKFVCKRGKLAGSRDKNEVGVGSRLLADLIARFYDDSLRKYAKGRLLDLGCGKVPLYAAYRAYVDDITCVDWEKGSHRNEYVDLECDLAGDLPFKDSEFDTIILSDVLEHIPQPERLWQEMNRILAANGKIIVNVPFFYGLHEQPYDYYRYTEFALRRFVANTGLNLVQLSPLGGTPEIIADISAKHIQHLPLAGTFLASAVQYITMIFVRTGLGKKISVKTSQAFPLGYFLVAEKNE